MHGFELPACGRVPAYIGLCLPMVPRRAFEGGICGRATGACAMLLSDFSYSRTMLLSILQGQAGRRGRA